jgi:hypothetical protein
LVSIQPVAPYQKLLKLLCRTACFSTSGGAAPLVRLSRNRETRLSHCLLLNACTPGFFEKHPLNRTTLTGFGMDPERPARERPRPNSATKNYSIWRRDRGFATVPRGKRRRTIRPDGR